MEFDTYYLVILKKGPSWSPEETPQVLATQEEHLAFLSSMQDSGVLAAAGPVVHHAAMDDIRGLHLLHFDRFDSLEEVKTLVEKDPAFRTGRLVGEYLTWYVPKGTMAFSRAR